MDLNKYLKNTSSSSKSYSPSLLDTFKENNKDLFEQDRLKKIERDRQWELKKIENEKNNAILQEKQALNKPVSSYKPISERTKVRNEAEKQATNDFIAKNGPAPKGIFSKEAKAYNDKLWDETNKTNKTGMSDGTKKFYKNLDFLVEAPLRTPFINKILNSTEDAIAPGQSKGLNTSDVYKSKNSKSKILDATGDLIGGTIGLGLNPAGATLPGKNLLNIADDIALQGSMKIAPKLGTKTMGKLGTSFSRGAIDGAVGGAVDTIRQGQDGKDLLGNVTSGALGGGLLFGASKGIGLSKDGIDNKVSKMFDDIGEPIKTIESPQFTGNPFKAPVNDGLSLPKKPIAEPKIEITPLNQTPKINIKNPNGMNFHQTMPPKLETTIHQQPKVSIRKEKVNVDGGIGSIKIEDRNTPIQKINDKGEIEYKDPLSSRKTKALQYDFPELHPIMKEQARLTLGELENGQKGETIHTYNYENGDYFKDIRTKDMSVSVNEIQQEIPDASYSDIKKGLNDLILDKGRENNANAKKIERVLDKHLTEGYEYGYGNEIIDMPPNKDYIETKNMLMEMDKGTKVNVNETVFKGNIETPVTKVIPGERKPIRQPLNIEPLPPVKTPRSVAAFKDSPIASKLDISEKELQDIIGQGVDTQTPIRTPNNPYKVNDNGDLQGESRFKTITSMESDIVDGKTKELLAKNDLTYDVKTDKDMVSYADRVVKTDVNKAYEMVMDSNKPSAETTSIGVRLITELQKQGDFRKTMEVINKMSLDATQSGQSIQKLSLIKKLTPDGMLYNLNKDIEKAKDIIDKKSPVKIKKANETISNVEQIVKNKELDDLAKEKELEKLFKKRKVSVKKTEIERILQLDSLDGFDNAKYKDLIYDKYGIPNLNEADIKAITEGMEKYQGMADGRAKDVQLAQVMKVVKDKIPSTTMEKIDSYRYINMLLNPRTLIKNIAGNMVNSAISVPKDFIGAGIDKVVSKKTGVRTKGNINRKEFTDGIKRGIKYAKEDSDLGIDTTLGGMKEGSKSKALRDIPVLGKLEKALSLGLSIGDRPFYEAAYGSSLKNAMKLNKVKEPTPQMIENAIQDGLEATYQQKTALGDLINSGKNSNNKAISIATKTILPFSQTPSSILDTALNYSPVGLARGGMNLTKNGLAKGGQRKGVNQLASGILGTGAMLGGYAGAKSGLLQGGENQDYETAAIERQAGKQPYSLKLGNKYFNLDWAQPGASPLMTGADMYKNGVKKSGPMEMVKSGINSVANNSFLSGANQMMDSVSQDGFGSIPQQLLKNYSSQLLPMSSMANAINKTIDSKARDTYDPNKAIQEVKKAMAKYPGLAQLLPQGVDSVGQGKLNNDGKGVVGRALNNMVTPWNSTQYNPSKAEKKALEVYNKTGETTQMPRLAPKYIEVTKNGVKERIDLTQKERIEMQTYMGTQTESRLPKLNDPSKMQTLLTQISKEAKDKIIAQRKNKK